MRPGRKIIYFTHIYYVFSLRGETGDSKTRHFGWVYIKYEPTSTQNLQDGVTSGDVKKILKKCQNEPTLKTNSSFFFYFKVDSAPMTRKTLARPT
jgi:hypothetical protein